MTANILIVMCLEVTSAAGVPMLRLSLNAARTLRDDPGLHRAECNRQTDSARCPVAGKW